MAHARTHRLLQASLVIFAIGLVAIVALFVTPLIFDGSTAPTAVYVATTAAPVGFVLALIATILTGRKP